MFWAGFASLIQFVNSVVWNGTAENVAPVWCDICKSCIIPISSMSNTETRIATKFIIGAGVGIPAASLCINRRLYQIATVQQTVSGFREVSLLWHCGLYAHFNCRSVALCLSIFLLGLAYLPLL